MGLSQARLKYGYETVLVQGKSWPLDPGSRVSQPGVETLDPGSKHSTRGRNTLDPGSKDSDSTPGRKTRPRVERKTRPRVERLDPGSKPRLDPGSKLRLDPGSKDSTPGRKTNTRPRVENSTLDSEISCSGGIGIE